MNKTNGDSYISSISYSNTNQPFLFSLENLNSFVSSTLIESSTENVDNTTPQTSYLLKVDPVEQTSNDANHSSVRLLQCPEKNKLLGSSEIQLMMISQVVAATVLECVFSYLPWRDIFRSCRGVSRYCRAMSERFVLIADLPAVRRPALFLRCREPFAQHVTEDHNLEVDKEALYSPSAVFETCNKLFETKRTTCRIFLGQLRREATVSFIEWLLIYAFDIDITLQMRNKDSLPLQNTGTPVAIENHRDRNTGRGKGCAWIEFNDQKVGSALLARHHRGFYDMYKGGEGLWLSPNNDLLNQEVAFREETGRTLGAPSSGQQKFNKYVRSSGSAGGKHNSRERGGTSAVHYHYHHMPRSTLVVEFPIPLSTQQHLEQQGRKKKGSSVVARESPALQKNMWIPQDISSDSTLLFRPSHVQTNITETQCTTNSQVHLLPSQYSLINQPLYPLPTLSLSAGNYNTFQLPFHNLDNEEYQRILYNTYLGSQSSLNGNLQNYTNKVSMIFNGPSILGLPSHNFFS